jgi:hypothetical protein
MATILFWASIVLCTILLVLALDIMGFFSGTNHFDVNGRVRITLIIPQQHQKTNEYKSIRRLSSLAALKEWAEAWRNSSLKKEQMW